MEKVVTSKRKKILWISIIANISILAIFKYFNFFIDNVNFIFNYFNIVATPIPNWEIILPIGLSFHTFQAMSYTIEVCRGNQKAEKHLGIYSLYVMFYPQLVAGPIERPQNLLHQFRTKHSFDTARIVKGLRLMLWGIFIKVVIADRLATYVNPVFNNVDVHNGSSFLMAAFFFTFQIYGDFAGYSLIAIGSAKVMGFTLMENFNRPYLSLSISQFWSRWHISLSTWFKDYVYIPLGGNKVSNVKLYTNIMIVFALSGFWHGSNWKFVIWGTLHGFYLIIENIWNKKFKHTSTKNKSIKFFKIFICITSTFFLTSFAWIFFRANSTNDAFTIIKKIVSSSGSIFSGNNPALIPYAIMGIFFILFVEIKREFFLGKFLFLNSKNVYIRFLTYIFLIITILLVGVFDSGQFIYFQF